MQEKNIIYWNKVFENIVSKQMEFDPAHDLSHIKRVVNTGIKIAEKENADVYVVLAACWLHDIVNVDKNSDLRNKASLMSAEKAVKILENINYPHDLNKIHHAIHAHSYSANIETKTLEAKIVQDADRLDALGALGISRCLMYSAKQERPIYNHKDPLAKNRPLKDSDNALDHFFTKLIKLPETMKTTEGKKIAEKRWKFMEEFVNQLMEEI